MIIGVTGGLASGKTTAAGYLKGYLKGHLIDADRLTRILLAERGAMQKSIIASFGKGVLNRRGSIDRAKLADRAFAARKYLKRLCEIVHPVVIQEIRRRIRDIYRKEKGAFIILDAPLLIETGLYKECGSVVVIGSAPTEQLRRASREKGMVKKDALSRIKNQMAFSQKAKLADYIIDNNSTMEALKAKCGIISKKIKEKNQRKRKGR